MTSKITIVGGGLVGRAWAMAYARGGCQVAVWDPSPDVLAQIPGFAEETAASLDQAGLLDSPFAEVAARIATVPDLAEALADCVYVQESAPEDIEVKRKLFAQLDELAPPEAVLASSSSALLPSAISEGLPGRARCLVAHPLNPPYLIPAVEIVPAPWTSEEAMATAETVLREAGQAPIVMRREIDAFVMNRLQGALLDEAFNLVGRGYASTEEIDVAIRDGLAVRWSILGPFETIDLNAPGGVRDYVERYAGIYEGIAAEPEPRVPWSGALLDQVEAERRAVLPAEDIAKRQRWRDQRLMELTAFRQAAKKDQGS